METKTAVRPNKKVLHDPKTGRTRVIFTNTKPSRTHQQFRDECNINNIVRQFRDGKPITHINKRVPLNRDGEILDLTNMPDYKTSLETIITARETFEALPSELRKKFFNDPQQMINFLNDPKNDEEAIKLGLRQKPEEIITLKEIHTELKNQNVKNEKTKNQKTKNDNDE